MVVQNLRRNLPLLPDEIWTVILSYLDTPCQLSTVSEVAQKWHKDVNSTAFESVWRRIWDSTASLRSDVLLKNPFIRVPGSWRDQVAASYRLERLDSANVVFLPPRYDKYGDVLPEDRINISPSTLDLEDVLGRAVSAHAFAQVVVVAFERGVGLLRQKSNRKFRTGLPQMPSLYFDDSLQLHGIQLLISVPGRSGTVLAVTHNNLIRIDLQENSYRPFIWCPLDTFHHIGAPVQITVSTDSLYCAVGYCSGTVRIVSLFGGCRYSFQLPEEAEHVAVNEKWAIATNSFQPIALAVWDLNAGNLHASQQGSNLLAVAGLAATDSRDTFILWDGRDTVRFFSARQATFVRTIKVHSKFVREPRSATEEAEHGAGSPTLGRGKMVLSADRKTAALATSNRVMVISLRANKVFDEIPQLDQARRALLAMSTDDRIVVTAESNAYGSLHTRVSGRVAIGAKPKMQVWDVERETLRCELELPSPATALSVCGDTAAVVCGAVGQVMVAFANSSQTESLPVSKRIKQRVI